MNFLFFTNFFPYRNRYDENYVVRGAEVFVYYLIKNLVLNGHNVTVYTTSLGDFNQVEVYQGLIVHRIRSQWGVSSSRLPFGLLKGILMEKDYDLVHINNSVPFVNVFGALYALLNRRTPCVLTYHGDIEHVTGSFLRRIGAFIYSKLIINAVLTSANVITCPSRQYIEESDTLFRFRKKVVYIPNGVDNSIYIPNITREMCRSRFSLPRDVDIILFLGSLIYRKGLHILVLALKELVELGKPVMLVIAGDGSMKKTLLSLSERLGLSSHIQFPGFIHEDIKPILYKASDIFCLPSILELEVLPLTVLEASAAGLPILVSNLKTYRGIIKNGRNGLLTLKGDYKDLTAKLLFLIDNDEIRRRLGENARKSVRKFSWRNVTKKFEELYRGLTVQ